MEIRKLTKNIEISTHRRVEKGELIVVRRSMGFIIYKDETVHIAYDQMKEVMDNSQSVDCSSMCSCK